VVLDRRAVSRDDLDAVAARYRTWGHWGPDDELGAANHVTPERVAAAAAEIRRGRGFSLALPMDNTGPMKGVNGRVNPQHLMLRDGGDMLADPQETGDIRVTDDAVYFPLQASTQWDALAHIMFGGEAYNGRGPASVTSAGARFNSVTNLRDRAVGRGVLLDVPRWLGRPWLEPGEVIQAEDLEECARAQEVTVGAGDFVLVRTGNLAQCRALGDWGTYCGGDAPGLGLGAADFLCPRWVAGVATDTWGIEAIPYETEAAGIRAPLHVVLLVNAGVHIGEMWDLEALAADCAADGRWSFFLAAPPLTITGAVGSPVNPLAIK